MTVKDIKKKIMYILGGTVLTEDFFWKNARFIITVFVIIVLYISNRYSCIEKMEMCIRDRPKGLLFWRSITQWMGGLGIVLFVATILPMGGNASVMYDAEVTGIGSVSYTHLDVYKRQPLSYT